MARGRNSKRALIAAALFLAAALAALFHTYLRAQGAGTGQKPELGVFSTLPLYWGEVTELSDLIAPDHEAHWARTALEQDYRLIPLDILGRGGDAGRSGDPLGQLDYLVMAQPRALSAAENVALDGWVRGGGRLLLFADPMLTSESAFAIGDRRRPHDVVLLSPILAHWGLALEFDDSQPAGERIAGIMGAQVPVDLPGQLSLAQSGDADAASCRIEASGLAAICTIGRGHALIIADAALLDGRANAVAARQAALESLTHRAFSGN